MTPIEYVLLGAMAAWTPGLLWLVWMLRKANPMEMQMHSKDILATELKKAGLPEMAARAADGYYHDFLSPLATPCLQLATDLAAVGTPAALALRARHMNGEFDATVEESDDWAASADGRAAFSELVASTRKTK